MFFTTLDQRLELRLFTSAYRRVLYYAVAHGFYPLLAGGFEIALLLRLSGSFERIVMANLCMYCLLFLAFFAGTLLLRSGKASRGFRLDLVCQIAASSYMLIFFDALANPYVLAVFFLLKGASEGLYWSTLHSAIMHGIKDEDRDRYALTLQTITVFMSVILPVIAGAIIHATLWPATHGAQTSVLPPGYFPVYGLCACIASLALFFSPRITLPPQTLRVTHLLKIRHAPGKAAWLAYLAGNSSTTICLGFAIGIINFKVLKNELNMGVYASLIALASTAFFVLVRNRTRRKSLDRTRMIGLGDAGEFLSRLLYVASPTLPGLLAKSILDTLVVPFRSMFAENTIRRRMEFLCAHSGLSIAEGILLQESFVFAVRVGTCSLLIFFLSRHSVEAVPMALHLITWLMGYSLIDYLLLRSINLKNEAQT